MSGQVLLKRRNGRYLQQKGREENVVASKNEKCDLSRLQIISFLLANKLEICLDYKINEYKTDWKKIGTKKKKHWNKLSFCLDSGLVLIRLIIIIIE